MKKNGTMLILAGFASCWAGFASAAVDAPPWCRTGSGRQGYNAGYSSEYNLIDSLWRQSFQGDCYRQEDFIAAMDVPFVRGDAGGGAFLRCRDAGLLAGMTGKFVEIQTSCVAAGTENGTNAGRFQAKQFCGVPQQAYRIRAQYAAVRLTSVVATQACKAAFSSYVNDHCPDRAGPELTQLINDSCVF